MLITRKSLVSGQYHTRDIPVTEEQLRRWTEGREPIQNVMPDVSAEDREFVMSGITPEEWSATFGKKESK